MANDDIDITVNIGSNCPHPASELEEIQLMENIKEILEWTPSGPAQKEVCLPRIVVFGQNGCGKSSLLNSMFWVTKFQTRELPGRFKQEVPCSRMYGNKGGANTNRLRYLRIGQMEFLDTRGFPTGAQEVDHEIMRICQGYRKFNTDISWNSSTFDKILDFFKTPGKPMDCAILVISAVNPDYDAYRRVIKTIKTASGCIPIIVMTSKNKIPDGTHAQVHDQLTGSGASVALMLENYLVDGEGKFPTSVDISKHIALCGVIQTIQHEYDHYLKGVRENEISVWASTKTVVRSILKLLLLLLLRLLLLFVGCVFLTLSIDALQWVLDRIVRPIINSDGVQRDGKSYEGNAEL